MKRIIGVNNDNIVVDYLCSHKGMKCAGAKGCGKNCMHTNNKESALNQDSVELIEKLFKKFNIHFHGDQNEVIIFFAEKGLSKEDL